MFIFKIVDIIIYLLCYKYVLRWTTTVMCGWSIVCYYKIIKPQSFLKYMLSVLICPRQLSPVHSLTGFYHNINRIPAI